MSNFAEAPPLPREPTLIRDQSLSRTQPSTEQSPSPPSLPPSPLPFPEVDSATDVVHPVVHPKPHSPKLTLPPKFPKFHPEIAETVQKNTTVAPSATPPPPPTAKTPKDAPKQLPLPPTFPPIHDEPDWSTPKPDTTSPSSHLNQTSPLASSSAQPASEPSPSQPIPEVSWNRLSSDNLSASLSQPLTQPEEGANADESKGILANILALLKRKKSGSEERDELLQNVQNASPSKPPIQKVKEMVCNLPDPTLVFVLEASVILLIHAFAPHVLRSWPARIVVPLLLVPTVAATALWRRTVVIARPGTTILSLVKPIPNAGMVVNMGETLRAREVAVLAAEERVREGQMRLEMLRKEIEARLPPQESIASLLESDKKAQATS
ncbi:hypothetical protein BWQ96_06118 [Gracilariopsis chorda]|uniref:Uncharacterized protein n=1 Tax=Gracilariopsis chorda TaxID=448386 RepID=A0A2V3IPX7_9FLOR|nr:hypothetical protein BWQ96_06118 [Gracilariopsis chorda]|eukprot:PXF44145.1 hypothetical protein BWQ96_06118 [Gracilariopsis chorda]